MSPLNWPWEAIGACLRAVAAVAVAAFLLGACATVPDGSIRCEKTPLGLICEVEGV